MNNTHLFDQYIYVLSNDDRYYVGITYDLSVRIDVQHKKGKNISTSKLGNTKNLKLVHHWKSPNYMLASKLERFCHQAQKKYGESIVLDIIKEMPEYTLEIKHLINEKFPTTKYEMSKMSHLLKKDWIK
jgi:predicted GIY-YIG superfamily endonuclease